MTKISEELAATARWIGNNGTAKRCKKNGNSVLFTYTDEGSMVIAGLVSKGDVQLLTEHIIKTLMEPLSQKSKKKYLVQMMESLLIMLDEFAEQEDDDE